MCLFINVYGHRTETHVSARSPDISGWPATWRVCNPCWKKQHMLVRYVLKHGCWFKLVLSWSCAGPKQLAPSQDQHMTSLNQLKPAMLQNIPNQHMLDVSTGTLSLSVDYKHCNCSVHVWSLYSTLMFQHRGLYIHRAQTDLEDRSNTVKNKNRIISTSNIYSIYSYILI